MIETRDHRVCNVLPGLRLARRLAAALVLLPLTACSLSYIDDTGRRIVIGPSLVRTATADAAGQACNLLHPVEISSLGITVHSGLGASTGSIGFQKFRDAALRNECPLPSTDEPETDGHAHAPRSDEDQRFVLYASLPGASLPGASLSGQVRGEAGTVVFVETYGLSFIATETETDITIGYGAVGAAAINDNSLIQGNPIIDLARSHPANGE